MNDKVVIAGTVKLRNTIKAKTNLHNTINGTPSWVVNTGGGGIVYPHYTGSYTVTPSASIQTLDTSDKVLDDDVTIQAVAQGSATTPATIITADPTISVSSGGLITATVSKTQQITPTVQEGYVSAGTPGNVGVSGSNTQQLTVQSAQTIHPASTDQSIASGKYLTGTQTFKAVTVSGLTADKILQGNVVKIGDADDDDRIMSVTGTASGGITPTGTKSITANGTGIDVYNYQYADVAVPNSYSASDEGKVVSNGALVAQTSDTVTANDTYDTTLIDELTVNVPTGGGGYTIDEIASGAEPSGVISITANSIIDNAFISRRYITEVTATSSTIGASAFSACRGITSVSLPNATAIGNNAFQNCEGLITFSAPLITTVSGYMLQNCNHMTNVNIPNATTIQGNSFQQTYALTLLDLPKVTKIKNNAFYNARVLQTLILRSDTVCTLDNIGAFTNSPLRGYSGLSATVYVPSSLISSYQTATNWSTLYSGGHCTFVAIEGSQYENYYADGTPISS